MSNSIATLERLRGRLGSTIDVARLERRNDFLRAEVRNLEARVAELEAEVLRLKPRDTKWGWLWWTLWKPEAVSVRIKAGAGEDPKSTRCQIYSAMNMAWKYTHFDVSIHHVGDDVWDVSRGKIWEWSVPDDQQA